MQKKVLCILILFILIVLNVAVCNNIGLYRKENWIGTYKLNNSIDHAEYLSIIQNDDLDNDKNLKYQWYNADEQIIAEGSGITENEEYLVLKEDDRSKVIILNVNNKTFFIDGSLEPVEIKKISNEPILSGEEN